MNISEIEAKIRAAVEAQRAKGVVVISDHFYSRDDEGTQCYCPLSCVAVENGYRPAQDSSLSPLGVDWDWGDSFIDGFDGNARCSTGVAEAYSLGRKLRAEYIEGKAL